MAFGAPLRIPLALVAILNIGTAVVAQESATGAPNATMSDLAVSSVAAPATVVAMQAFEVSFVIRNVGVVPSLPSTAKVVLSRDEEIAEPPDLFLTSMAVGSIATGASVTRTA